MVRSFRHRGLKRLYERGDRSRVPADMADRIEDVLAALDAARTIDDMDRPSFRLHPLTGNRKNHWAVTIRANWRITFRLKEGHVSDVDFVDYH